MKYYIDAPPAKTTTGLAVRFGLVCNNTIGGAIYAARCGQEDWEGEWHWSGKATSVSHDDLHPECLEEVRAWAINKLTDKKITLTYNKEN